jgi:GTPase involved in cell partitioning and DNA repair
MIIDNIYILETKRIIDNYNYVLSEIEKYSLTLNDKKDSMLEIQKNLNIIDRNNENELFKEQQVYQLIDKYNNEISKIEKSVKPLIDKIEITKKEISLLYTIIKEKYSEYTEDEIKDQISKQLQELITK